MRLSTRLLSAAALTGALVVGIAPAAAAVPALGGYSTVVHERGYGDVTVHCPAGYHVTGGGVAVDHKEEIATMYSRPTQDGRGWQGRALGEVEQAEKKGEKKGDKKSGKKAGDGVKAEEAEVSGLPITVYAVCAL